MKVYGIIAAGGKGVRLKSNTPKQFLHIEEKPIIAYSLQVFQDSAMIDKIVIAVEKKYFNLLQFIKQKYGLNKISDIVEGGTTRQQSVINAFKSLDAITDDLIAVHDAARPFLSVEILEKALKLALKFDNVVTAVSIKDTIFKAGEFVQDYMERDDVYYAQTPQIFRYGTLKKAFEKAILENFIGTDESMLVKRIGQKVYLSEGSIKNFKITTNEDFELAKEIFIK